MSSARLVLAGQLITGVDDEPIDDAAVLVDDGVVRAVGRRDEVAAPDGVEMLDCGDLTVLPGLVDCHEHLLGRTRYGEGTEALDEPEATWAVLFADHARRCLENGVTTVRVPGSYRAIDLGVRRAAVEGFLRAPRLVCAGQAITMTGGHGRGAGVEVDGAAACQQAARAQLAAGADFLKVMASGGVGTVRVGEDPTHPELTVDELAAVVTVAESARTYVTAHADGVDGIGNALDAGVHCIEHGIYLTADQAATMAARGVRMVPTLSTMLGIARRGAEWGLPAEWVGIAEGILDVHRESFQNALDAGVVFGVGTDGYGDVVDEIVEFTTYGVSPMRAIQAATRDSAQITSPGARYGVLAVGHSADLIGVAGDPLADLAALRGPSLVMLEGRVEVGSG